jgi:hypothetical protein
MKSLDAMPEEKAPAAKKEGKSSDKELVSMMGMAMLDNGGLDTIKAALQSSQDPGQVVGQFVAQMAGQLAQMTQEQMGIDPSVYGEPDGFLDQILNYIEMELQLPPEFSDQVYGETLEVMKAAAAGGGEAEQQPGAPAPAPAGGMPGLDAGGM